MNPRFQAWVLLFGIVGGSSALCSRRFLIHNSQFLIRNYPAMLASRSRFADVSEVTGVKYTSLKV